MAEQDKEFPYMPIYWSDWLTGQKTSDMTAEEEGAFLNLLLWAWGRKPACTLPSDPDWLAVKSKLGRRFDKVWPRLAGMFVELEDGTLRNEKQWKVYQDRVRLSNAGSNGGRKARANDQAKRQAEVQANAQAEVQPSVSVSVSGILPEGAQAPKVSPKIVELPTDQQNESLFAGLVKKHFWLRNEPPALMAPKYPGWHMGREITIGRQWAKDYGGWDVLLALIPLFRKVLDIEADQPLSCVFFNGKQDRHKLSQVIGHYQRQQEIEAGRNSFQLRTSA
jgi:uncharacterized protein YdaU (DUF1376 family)